MPETCGAKNRSGKPCTRIPAKGKKRCHFHGGKSTGAKTAPGKAKAATASMTHGLYQTREAFTAHGHPSSYLEGLFQGMPELLKLVPADAEVGPELRFARMKLLRSELLGADDAAQAVWVEQIRKIAATQNELRPGGNASGEFKITLNVVGAEPAGTTTATPVPTSTEPACS